MFINFGPNEYIIPSGYTLDDANHHVRVLFDFLVEEYSQESLDDIYTRLRAQMSAIGYEPR